MSRKFPYLVLSGLLIVVLLLTGLQSAPRSTYAAEPSATPESDFPVSVDTTGVIQSISATQIVLTDNSTFKIDTKTKLPKTALQPGMTVTVSAELDSEELVASSIRLGDGNDASSNQSGKGNDDKSGKGNGSDKGNDNKGAKGTPSATEDASSGKGKGNGNDNKGGKGNGNSSDDKGGKGKGKGNDSSSDDKGGKGKGNGNDKKGGNGKGNDNKGGKDADAKDAKNFDTCMARTDQPVAKKLAEALGVPYADIMSWHCKGNGFAEIARAYLITKAPGSKLTDVGKIFALRDSGEGWKQIIEDEADLQPDAIQTKGILKGGKKDK